MSSVGEEMGDSSESDFEDLDMDEFEEFDDLGDLGGSQEKTMDEKLKDIFLQDTSGKSLSRYNLEDYSFMPDSQGSQRILRAIDYGIGGLDMVISDLVIGLAQISKDMQQGA
jgi:hypothetical protein